MDATVELALVGLLVALVPFATVWMQGRQRQEEKQADWDRQDIVAAHAAAQSKAIIKATEDASAAANERQSGLDKKLDQVHTIVNSGFVAQMRVALLATQSTLAAKQALNAIDPTDILKSEIALIVKSISNQEVAILEREEATAKASIALQDPPPP